MLGRQKNNNKLLKNKRNYAILPNDTLAMPLEEAHFGGSFLSKKVGKSKQKMLHSMQHLPILIHNTPAMPLYDAQIGGFFYVWRKQV